MSDQTIWLTVAEAAKHASVGEDTIYDACLKGEMMHTKIGGRRLIRLKREWVDEWLERHVRDVEPLDNRDSVAKMIVELTKGTKR